MRTVAVGAAILSFFAMGVCPKLLFAELARKDFCFLWGQPPKLHRPSTSPGNQPCLNSFFLLPAFFSFRLVGKAAIATAILCLALLVILRPPPLECATASQASTGAHSWRRRVSPPARPAFVPVAWFPAVSATVQPCLSHCSLALSFFRGS